MAAFIYRAATAEGKVVEGTVEATDNGAVAIKLQDMGLLPIKVAPASKKTALTREVEWPWKRKKIRRKDLLVFTQELHTLVKSGFPLDRKTGGFPIPGQGVRFPQSGRAGNPRGGGWGT